MNPTLVLGAVGVVLAVLHARDRDSHRTRGVIGFGIATMISGLLGLTLGVSRTLSTSAGKGDETAELVLTGVSESLNNVILAFVLVLLAVVITSVGSLRQATDH